MAKELQVWVKAIRPNATDAAGVLIGLLLVAVGWLSRNEAEPYSLLMGGGGVALIAISLFGRILKRAKVGPVDLEMQERAAAATAASAEVPIGTIEEQIGSTDDGPPSPSPDDSDVVGNLNYLAGDSAIRAIFDEATATGPLRGADLRLYLYDEHLGQLAPIFASAEARSTWPPGRGATGVAYETEEFVLAQGDAVHDSTYGLSEGQQARYSDLSAVAAMPTFNAGGTVIGVVTASSTSPEPALGDDDSFAALSLAALMVSRVLVELLQWFDDR